MAPKKQRRRVERVSDAVDYDRTADRNPPSDAHADEDRMVIFDSELATADDELSDDPRLTADDYRQQRPPHYGN